MLVGKVFFYKSIPLFDICKTQVGYAGILIVDMICNLFKFLWIIFSH